MRRRSSLRVRAALVVSSLTAGLALTAGPALAQNSCIPPPPGMVAWWTGDKTSLDLVGGMNGTMMNGATFAAGRVGPAFKLDGLDDYVQIPFDPRYNFSPSGQFTVEAWMNPGRLAGSPRVAPDYRWQCLVVKSKPDTVWDWGIHLRGDIFTSGSQRSHFLISTTAATIGTWYHVAVTYNAGSMTLYVNGVAEASSAGSISQSDGALALGRKGESAPHPDFFQGLLDEVTIYNRALGASEIQAIYKVGALGKCKPASMVPARSDSPQVTTGEPAALLQQAQHTELVDGQPAEAIEIYRGLLARYGSNRVVAATALVQMGQCYEKLGNVESRKAYERVLREFPEQRRAVELARARLSALNGRAAPDKRPAMAVRQVWDSYVHPGGTVSRDGTFLATPDPESGNLGVRDLATGEMRRLTTQDPGSAAEFATASVPSPDGSQVAYAWFNKNQQYDLRVIGLDRPSPRVLVADQEYVKPGDWSPDGKWIPACLRKKDGGNQIVRVSVADGSVQALKDLGWRRPLKLGFSSDGRYIVYDFPSRQDSPARDISLLAVDGGREIPLVRHPANDFAPVWTPDGMGVVFVSDRNGSPGLWLAKVSDGKPEAAPQLVKADVGQMWPMGFARNGSLYYGLETATEDLYLASLDKDRRKLAGEPVQVAKRYPGWNYSPDWSPDGRFLAYVSVRGPLPDETSPTIVIRSLDTEQERDLAPQLRSFTKVYWSADGRSFIVRGQDLKGVNGVFRVDAGSGNAELLVAKRAEDAWVDLVCRSADGSKIILTRSVGNVWETSLRDLATGVEKQVPVGNAWAALSPDVGWVVFIARDQVTRASRLTVLPTGEGERRQLLSVDAPGFISGAGFGWSADGQRVWFTRTSSPPGGSLELWSVPFKQGNPEPAGLAMPGLRHLRFHPDGSRIAFISGEQKYELWVLENFLHSVTQSKE